MICFVTAYDGATSSNLSAVKHRLPADALVASDATPLALAAALAGRPEAPLVAWSHGSHDGFMAQNGCSALPVDDLRRFAARSAFAYACHTGSQFGRQAQAAGWTWWGYTGPVSAPGDGEVERLILGDAMWAVATLAVTATTVEGARAALQEAFDVTMAHAEALDDAPDASTESYLCLLHLRDRLRAWHPQQEGPLFHPACTSPILLV